MDSRSYLMESPPEAVTIINGKQVDYFGGSSYYCFNGKKEIIDAAVDAVKSYGTGSATSRLVYGNNPVLYEVEKNASAFFESEDSLYTPAGYFGMTVLLESLKDSCLTAFADSESHYSVINACRTTRLKTHFFNHLDPVDLKAKIHRHLKPGMKPIVLCDSIFPVNGELSPLAEYMKILDDIEDSALCVDDAHATGVIGEKGKGAYEYFNIKQKKNVQLYSSGTLSKALGGQGGIIYGKRGFIKKLKSQSTTLNSSIPVSVPAAAGTAKALEILHKEPELREKLWSNVKYIKKLLKETGIGINDSPVPIVCFHTGRESDLKRIQNQLFDDKNIAVSYISSGKYTSVPSGGAIRISVFSTHTKEQIDRLIFELTRLL